MHPESEPKPAAVTPSPFELRDLGRVPYRQAWELQKQLVEERFADRSGDVLLICEHEPVITTGRATREGFLVDGRPNDRLNDRFQVFEVERGGEATYHGPGQVMAYPIVKLDDGRHDLHAWMRALEESVVDTALIFGLPTSRRPGETGVWTADGQRKLCSIGVAARRWVTYHGLALNVSTDLSHFAVIHPCGYDAAVMTSLEKELGVRCPDRCEVVAVLGTRLAQRLARFRRS